MRIESLSTTSSIIVNLIVATDRVVETSLRTIMGSSHIVDCWWPFNRGLEFFWYWLITLFDTLHTHFVALFPNSRVVSVSSCCSGSVKAASSSIHTVLPAFNSSESSMKSVIWLFRYFVVLISITIGSLPCVSALLVSSILGTEISWWIILTGREKSLISIRWRFTWSLTWLMPSLSRVVHLAWKLVRLSTSECLTLQSFLF